MSHMCSCTHPKPCCFLFSRIAGNVGSCVNFSEISLLTISLKKKKKNHVPVMGWYLHGSRLILQSSSVLL